MGLLPAVALVDSVAWEHELGEGYLQRVEVWTKGRTDTIPGVLTAELPVALRQGRLLGFSYQADAVQAAYEYDPRKGSTQVHSLPDDLNGVFSAPSFAPDGRHLAYIVFSGDGTAWAAVRTWPRGQLVWRSKRVEVPATDAAGGNLVRWLSPDTVEVFIETGRSTGGGWYHVRGSVRQRRIVAEDSVFALP